LEDVPVAANHLRHRQARFPHVAAVRCCAFFGPSDDLGGGLHDAQRFDELVQEERYAILQLV
jgi:hypothetical protein